MFGLEQGCAHTPTSGFCIGRLGLRYPAGRATEIRNKGIIQFLFHWCFQAMLSRESCQFPRSDVACRNENRLFDSTF